MTSLDASSITVARRWSMLAASVAAQAGASVAINGPAFLIPQLQDDRGLSLAEAGTVAAAPIAGVMLTLFVWGLVVDRIGERAVLLAGLGGTTLLGIVATMVHGTVPLVVVLFVVGMFAACTGSASGRIVVGWFPPQRRGLAMGIRQMAQPLGVAIAAATIAVAAERVSVSAALWIPVVATALACVAVLVLVIDPPRPAPTDALTANPYRADNFLARIHGVSVLLVVPQFLVWTYSLTWLVQHRHWSAAAAGALVAGHARARRPRPDRRRAALRHGRFAGPAVALGRHRGRGDDGTARPDRAARGRGGADGGRLDDHGRRQRAGVHQRGGAGRLLLVGSRARHPEHGAVPHRGRGRPGRRLAITHWGYAATYALAAVCPVIALPLVPRRDETSAE